MNRKEVAAVLEEIAMLLELSGENPFKSRSYTNVARQIEQCEEDIEALVKEGRLRELKGVGDAIEKKITELITTGSLKYHKDLRAQFPETLFELFSIPGLGAKRVRTLYDDLQIASLGELEYACQENRLTSLKGFGPKMQQKVLDGIAFAKGHEGLSLAGKALPAAQELVDALKDAPSIIRIQIAGSLRRAKEVVKDIDILVSSTNPKDIMERFTHAEAAQTVTSKGDTKSSVILASGIAADLRVVTDEQFPYALAHFTGSKDHNVVMRRRAKDRGLKLNEYGLFKGKKLIACTDESAIFAALDLPFIPPELREDQGEFDADRLPGLVTQEDLLGVVHCHSRYSDGADSIEVMARAAEERGYTYLGIADHSQSAAYAGGLTPENVARQHAEIDKLNRKLNPFRILKGIESDIRTDGSLDYDETTLKSFEFIIASVHSKLDMEEDEATKRLIKAIENPYTTIIGHPTGRLLLSRKGYPLNIAKIIDACAANRVAIEINANPHRLDLDWRYIRRARDKGVKLCIGPDAHSTDGLDHVVYGLGAARKGWCTKDDILNSLNSEEFLKWHKSN